MYNQKDPVFPYLSALKSARPRNGFRCHPRVTNLIYLIYFCPRFPKMKSTKQI